MTKRRDPGEGGGARLTIEEQVAVVENLMEDRRVGDEVRSQLHVLRKGLEDVIDAGRALLQGHQAGTRLGDGGPPLRRSYTAFGPRHEQQLRELVVRAEKYRAERLAGLDLKQGAATRHHDERWTAVFPDDLELVAESRGVDLETIERGRRRSRRRRDS